MKLRINFLAITLAFFSLLTSSNGAAQELPPEGPPKLELVTEIRNGYINLLLSAPLHLTINEKYASSNYSDHVEVGSIFLSTNHPSENPKSIAFYIIAENCPEGVKLYISEIQLVEEKGWFSDSVTKTRASQKILIENHKINTQETPKLTTVKNIAPYRALFKFKLVED